MEKITFGKPENIVPSKYCGGLNYIETEVDYDINKLKFKTTARG